MVKRLVVEKEVHAEYFSGDGIVLDLTLTVSLLLTWIFERMNLILVFYFDLRVT